ncbi:hypothetical protein LINPERHAP2_LOCUS5470, partial [Linum perenne]
WVLQEVGFYNAKYLHPFLPPFLNLFFFNTILSHGIIMASHRTNTTFFSFTTTKLHLISNRFDPLAERFTLDHCVLAYKTLLIQLIDPVLHTFHVRSCIYI